jgi:hypothetical protein
MYRCPYFYYMMRYNNKRIFPQKSFTIEEALSIAKYLNIQFDKFDSEQFRIGLNVELEHGSINPFTNITNDDPIITGKITLAHLNEYPDYYKRLTKMEEEAEKYWEG